MSVRSKIYPSIYLGVYLFSHSSLAALYRHRGLLQFCTCVQESSSSSSPSSICTCTLVDRETKQQQQQPCRREQELNKLECPRAFSCVLARLLAFTRSLAGEVQSHKHTFPAGRRDNELEQKPKRSENRRRRRRPRRCFCFLSCRTSAGARAHLQINLLLLLHGSRCLLHHHHHHCR